MSNHIRGSLFGTVLAATALVAGIASADCNDVTIKEVGVNLAPDYDVHIKFTVTGSDSYYRYARHGDLGHNGVDRTHRAATAALLSGRHMYLCYGAANDSGITMAYLK